VPPPPHEYCTNMCMYLSVFEGARPNLIHANHVNGSAAESSLLQNLPAGDGSNFIYASNARASDVLLGPGRVTYGHTFLTSPHDKESLVNVDELTPLGSYLGVDYVASYPSGSLKTEAEYIGDGHMYGLSKCMSFGRCEGTQQVGSSCKGGEGYCYESSAGTLECGRTVAVGSRLGYTGPAATGKLIDERSTHHNYYRCPRGSPNTYGNPTGTVVVAKRLSFGGCMIPGDAHYDIYAEVHVAPMCAGASKTFFVGCLFPGALNYAPGSNQNGFCQYETYGCIDSTALNFHSRATIDDGSCVLPTRGCTLPEAGYEGVPSDTPMYKGLSVGVPSRDVGMVLFPSYGTVTRHDADANVLEGCQVIVEGCLNSSAINYDPEANTNTGTWCVPMVRGCMMPQAINFDPSATVNDLATCIAPVHGCMSSRAINYNPLATKNSSRSPCFEATTGCLNPLALNFNCSVWRDQYTPCTESIPRPTAHVEYICNYQVAPPPAPLPHLPPGTMAPLYLTYEFVTEGEVADITEEVIDAVKAKFAAEAGVAASEVVVTIESASVLLRVQILMEDPEMAAAVKEALSYVMATADAANAFLSETGIPTVTSAPKSSVGYGALEAAPQGPLATGVIVGISLGGGAVACNILLLCFCFCKRRRDRIAPKPYVVAVDGEDAGGDTGGPLASIVEAT